MSSSTSQKAYKDTLNLPKTAFPMRARLVDNEPATVERWRNEGLYRRIRAARAGAPAYVFHDGPPYANGPIHLGHLLNKVLKDMVVRSKTMAGYDCPFVPGWDCHGLPIEHKVMEELGDKAREMDAPAIRERCRETAEHFVGVQAEQIERLLTLGDYENPYLTMRPQYEADVLEVFARLVEQGLVYRDLKPVHWSVENRTALAEAELEYHERTDTSIHALFDVERDGAGVLAERVGDRDLALMVWTTTPWTIPANLATAVAPAAEYGLYPVEVAGRRIAAVIATDLAERALGRAVEPLGLCRGRDLIGLRYAHPFADRAGRVIEAEHVTLDEGTGLVHIAPGHGKEDHATGQAHGLPTYCPVRGDGTFDESVPDWLAGETIWSGNEKVVEKLRDTGHLWRAESWPHSYPHDWRSKTPVIFRATEQWFVGVDRPAGRPLRRRALDAVEREVSFLPPWGRQRLAGMIASRPDWCLSRQRSWGLPIPAFFPPAGTEGEPLLTAASVRAVGATIRERGSDAFFTAGPEELLAGYDPADDPEAPGWARETEKRGWRKSGDIFDVWFESGSSWNAVLEARGMGFPADLYLEGSDQHRGWFQLSLLPAVAVTGQAPYRNLLTHGFMVDKHGHKMSKSAGNALEVQDLLKRFGADVCRWWVSSLAFEDDVKVDTEFFEEAGESYRKVRNTIRFLLGNLRDFDPAAHHRPCAEADAESLDAWALGELAAAIEGVEAAYERLDFRRAHDVLFHLCNETLSAVYLAAVKDRLYCDAPDSDRRRRAQTALHAIADALIRLLAPLLPHTAEEAWRSLHGADVESVHLERLPEAPRVSVSDAWSTVMERRDAWLRALETARREEGIDNPLDAGLRVPHEPELARIGEGDLADLCGVSRVALEAGRAEIAVADLSESPRCERSWKRDGTVRERSDGGMLSDRDAEAVGV